MKGKEMKVELVIVWETGEKESLFYNTREEAETIERGYHTVFGNQIAFTGINEK